MKFRFTADIEFEAADLDAAFALITRHFIDPGDDCNSAFEFIGRMDIQPVAETKE